MKVTKTAKLQREQKKKYQPESLKGLETSTNDKTAADLPNYGVRPLEIGDRCMKQHVENVS